MKWINFTIRVLLLPVFILVVFVLSNTFAEDQAPPEGETTAAEEIMPEEENATEEPEILYSAGPWKGKVIDAENGKPIEGAVVAAIWYREYDTRFTPFKDFHEAKEVLTDANGYFEIPAYTETGEDKESWAKPQIPGPEGPIEFFVRGPYIKDPEFIVYKPAFYSYPQQTELIIFAVDPFVVEYRNFYSEKINDEEVMLFKKDEKNFSEGLVYSGGGCFPLMVKFGKKARFRFSSVFYELEGAGEKLNKLDIPLECPDDAEPIPIPPPGYKSELKNPLKDGGYVTILLSRADSDEDRLDAIPKEPSNVEPEKLPILFGFINKEKSLQEGKDQNKE